MKNTKLPSLHILKLFGYCLFLEMVYIGIENYHAGNHAKKVFMVSVEIQRM